MPIIAATPSSVRVRLYMVGTDPKNAATSGVFFDNHGLAKFESDSLTIDEKEYKVFTYLFDIDLSKVTEQ